MICLGANVWVYLACGATDMRKGIGSLAALVESGLHHLGCGVCLPRTPWRQDQTADLGWQGFCLYYKILENGRFPWSSVADGTARLMSAQLAMLWVGIGGRPGHRHRRGRLNFHSALRAKPARRPGISFIGDKCMMSQAFADLPMISKRCARSS